MAYPPEKNSTTGTNATCNNGSGGNEGRAGGRDEKLAPVTIFQVQI